METLIHRPVANFYIIQHQECQSKNLVNHKDLNVLYSIHAFRYMARRSATGRKYAYSEIPIREQPVSP